MHLVTFEPIRSTVAPTPRSRSNDPVRPAAIAAESHGGPTRFSDGSLGYESLDLLRPGTRRLGAVMPPGPRGGDVVDLNRALAVRLAHEDVGAPEVEADSLLPSELRSFLRAGESALSIARAAFAWAVDGLDRYDRPDLERAGVLVARSSLRLHAPVPRPGKLIAATNNYAAPPGDASGTESPPGLVVEASTSVIGTDDDIVLPRASDAVDHAGSLAVVIGRRACDVSADEALAHVAGFTIANDVAARSFDDLPVPGSLARSCDTFTPLGPCLVTRDAIGDPQKLRLETRVNGEQVVLASTADMIVPIAEVVALASRPMTLEPGDVILTGAPVALARPRPLREGDVVEVDVEGIGRLRNHVCPAREPR